MNPRERAGSGDAARPGDGAARPPTPPAGRYARVIRASAEDTERFFSGAVMAVAAGLFEIRPPEGQDPAGARLPRRMFVPVVPDAYGPLAPLFELRGTGAQRWPVAGQFGWSAAAATHDQPPRVALKLNITAPLRISARVLFLPQFPGIRHALEVAAQGGFIALMRASQWEVVARLAREGTEFASLLDRAVILSIEPAVYLGPFLANLPRDDN